MKEQLGRADAVRTPEVSAFRGTHRTAANIKRRVRKALPWGMREQWKDTLDAIETSALFRNIVAMSADCVTDDGRYAVAEELIDAIDSRLRALGKPPMFGDRVRSFKREVAEADAALTEVLLHPNDPNAKERAREQLNEAERAVDQLGDAL